MTLKGFIRALSRRPTNRCHKCGYTWTPRGRNYSLRCPNCQEPQLQAPGGCLGLLSSLAGCVIAVILLLLFASIVIAAIVSLGLFAGSSMPPKNNKEKPLQSATSIPPVKTKENNQAAEVKRDEGSEAPPEATKVEPTPAAVNETPKQPPLPVDDKKSPRLWKDVSGKFSVEATFNGVVNKTDVLLKKADGSTAKVPIEKLSEEDRQWLKERKLWTPSESR